MRYITTTRHTYGLLDVRLIWKANINNVWSTIPKAKMVVVEPTRARALSPRQSVVHGLLAVHFECLVHEVPRLSFTDFWQ
ncbi:hypothetical protein PAXRUDRAFT_835990, partial [Paxillus rubicundulus Ve08.2h10]